MNDWNDAFDDENGVDAWPAFVDVLAGALTFLLVGFAGLSAEHIHVKAAERSATNRKVSQSKTALANAHKSAEDFVELMKSARVDVDGKTCVIEAGDRVVVCTFGNRLAFESKSWNLRDPGARELVRAFGRSLNTFATRGVVERVTVEGHADERSFNMNGMTNWELSTARAGHVVRLLEESVPPKSLSHLLTASGYAEHARKDRPKDEQRVVVIRVVMRIPATVDPQPESGESAGTGAPR